MDFQGPTLWSDTDFLLLCEIAETFCVIEAIGDAPVDNRSPYHINHIIVHLMAEDSMNNYALKWGKRPMFGVIGEQSPFGKELQASRLRSRPAF